MELNKRVYFFVAAISLYSTTTIAFINLGLISGPLFTLLDIIFLGLGVLASKKILVDSTFENKYFKFIFWMFFLYSVGIILRVNQLTYDNFKELIQSDFLFWPYLIPLVVFIDKDLRTFAYLANAAYVLGILFLILSIVMPSLILNRNPGEDFIHPFAFGCGFLFLNARYVSPIKRYLAFVVLLVALLSMTLLARRNGVLTYSALTIIGLIINVIKIPAEKFFKLIPIFATVFIGGLIGFDHIPSSFSEKLNNRLTEDSRSNVFTDLFKGMEEHELFGKGMNGTYYSPSGGENPDEGIVWMDVEYRNVIENGYMQLFLNGGIVYDVLFLLIMLPAVFLGFFKSKNQLVKSFSILIFLWLIDMIVYGMPRLIYGYVIVWIGVGVCYKKSLRDKTDFEISEAFNNS